MAVDVKLLFDANILNANKEQNDFKQVLCAMEKADTRKQSQILIELYHTEISFLLQLELIIHHFIQPLSSNRLLSSASFDIIFGNILQLYNINKELLNAIKVNPHNVSIAFTTFAPYLKLYSIYAYGYKKGLETLEELQKKNKKLNEFVRRQETRPEVGATLISLLIAPIQRIPRYRLLLLSLIQCSSSHHPHYQQMLDALSKVEETAEHINRLVTEAEEGEAMVQLARRLGDEGANVVVPGRKILKEGVVRKSSKNGGCSQQRYLVLFTDALLVCKGGAKGLLTVSRLLPLRHVAVEPALGSTLFKVTCGDDEMLLYTATPELGCEWIQAVKDAVKNHVVSRKTLRKDSSKRAIGTRRLGGVKQTTAAILRRARRACRTDVRPLISLKRLGRNNRKSAK